MSGSLILFILSLIGMLTVFFFNKMFASKPVFIKASDDSIVRWMKKGRKIIKFVNRKTIGLLVHFLIEEIEEFFNKVFRKLKNKVKK